MVYHYKARAYDPTTGRFLQTDPVGYKSDIDLYSYVKEDPVDFADPTGLDCVARANGGQTCTENAGKLTAAGIAVAVLYQWVHNAVVHTYEAATGQSGTRSDAKSDAAQATSSVRRSDQYVVRVQAQGAALAQPNTSTAVAQDKPVTASQVRDALVGVTLQLPGRDQKTLAPAFGKAADWATGVAARGGTAPVSKSFYVPGIRGSQARVDIEVIMGPINIVPDE